MILLLGSFSICTNSMLSLKVLPRHVCNCCLFILDLTGKNIAQTVVSRIKIENIPLKNMVTAQTDGCNVMEGRMIGCKVFMKKEVPTLPDLGTCVGHHGGNIIKKGVNAMCPELPTLFTSIHSNLEKHYEEEKSIPIMCF